MKIAVAGVDAALERGVDHVVRLFFEAVDVVFDPPEAGALVDADAWLTVAVGDGTAGVGAARAALTTADGASFDAAAARPQGKLRYAVHDAVLQVFEQWTGIVQPWGVLTGIRPTKLMHQAVQAGQAPADIAAMLTTEYKVKPDKIALMAHIVERQLTAIPDLYNLKRRGQRLHRHSLLPDQVRLLHLPGVRHPRLARLGRRLPSRPSL